MRGKAKVRVVTRGRDMLYGISVFLGSGIGILALGTGLITAKRNFGRSGIRSEQKFEIKN